MTISLRNIKLKVVNDVICPNCYIGQHELLTAISYVQNTLRLPLHFDIEFLPFRLISSACINDDQPYKIDKITFFTKKLGAANFELLKSSTEKWSEEKNIAINFDGVVSQSMRAHRISRKAYKSGGQKLQLPFLCEIFKAHLSDGKDVADPEILAAISEKVGIMSKDETIAFLKTNELEDEVEDFCRQIKDKGLTGVPMICIDDKWAVSGGQSAEVFIKIFQKMAECSINSNTATPVILPVSLSPPQHAPMAQQAVQPLC